MHSWDSGQYLKFISERSQPAEDLLARLRGRNPQIAIDLGCGPGNSTALLQQAFPAAQVSGLDSSEDMLARARKEHPELRFLSGDAGALEGRYDLIFSNSCLQWVPAHETLLPRLMRCLNPGGALAAQFSMNDDEPLYQIIRTLTAEPRWGFSRQARSARNVLAPETYYDLLRSCSDRCSIWQTVYFHPLASPQALLDWVKGSRLRPYLAELSTGAAAAFETELLLRLRQAYPEQAGGGVLLRQRRFFLIAERA